MAGVHQRIQRGGVHPSIKGEVWEFLLGCFDPKSTSAERKELMQRRRKRRAIDIVRNSTVTTVHTIQAEKDESLYTIHWSTTSVQTSMRHRKLGNYNHRIRLYLEATVKIFGWWNFYVPQPIKVEHSRGKLRRCARGGSVVGKCYYVAMRGFKFVN